MLYYSQYALLLKICVAGSKFFHTWRAIIKVDHLTGKQCDVCMEVKITIILETEEIITNKTVSDKLSMP